MFIAKYLPSDIIWKRIDTIGNKIDILFILDVLRWMNSLKTTCSIINSTSLSAIECCEDSGCQWWKVWNCWPRRSTLAFSLSVPYISLSMFPFSVCIRKYYILHFCLNDMSPKEIRVQMFVFFFGVTLRCSPDGLRVFKQQMMLKKNLVNHF